MIVISYAQQQSGKDPNHSAKLSSNSNQSVTIVENLSFSSFSYAKSEPLLLLLAGIAVFVAATTAKKAANRKRSGLR